MTKTAADKSSAPTLSDVAARAGVNKVTASVVLSGSRANTRVSEATRQRILAAAADLRYQPNALARSLRRQQTNIVGFYMGGFIDTRDLFLGEIVSGLKLGCERHRRDFLMHGTFRGGSTDDIYAELVNGKVDGLVLHARGDDPLVQRLAASHLPVVAVTDPVPDLPTVTVDDAAGSRLLAAHLAGRGHRRVLYAGCPHQTASTARRQAAFFGAAAESGMTVSVVPAHVDADGVPGALTGPLLAAPAGQRPTAVVCWNDQFAYLLIEHVRRHGVRVPDDLAVAGFDGATTAIPPAYRLTTILAPWHEVAQTAVALLLSPPSGKPAPEEVMLPVRLVVGETA